MKEEIKKTTWQEREAKFNVLENIESDCCNADIKQQAIVWLGLNKDYPCMPFCSKCGKEIEELTN